MISSVMTKIKELHIENTSLCNASCVMCARNVNGQGIAHTFHPGSLSFSDFQTKITVNITHLEKVFFCGTLGDPCADNNLLDKIRWLKSIRPSCVVGINTNGSIQNAKWWTQLAQLLTGTYDYVVFSIDGLEDTNHVYRVNAKWHTIMKGVNTLRNNFTGKIGWRYLVFEHNYSQVAEANRLSTELGLNWFKLMIGDSRTPIHMQLKSKTWEQVFNDLPKM